MRHFITFICVTLSLWVTGQSLSAQPVSQSEAKKKAMIFFNNAASDDTNVKSRIDIRKAPQLKLANNSDDFYIFNDDANGGYVIIAGEERMPEVLGYSYNGHIESDKIPCNMQMLLDGYAMQIRYLQDHPEVPAVKISTEYHKSIPQLLSTEWNQYDPYNNMCPLFNDQRCITGCVATAMAQIMYYHKWPNETSDVIPEYTTRTNQITMPSISPTKIDWNNMLPSYDGSYTKTQGDAVALLMKICGASVEMDYGLDASAGYFYTLPWHKYWGYAGDMKHVYQTEYNDETWTQLLYDELSEGCPIFYCGTGPEDSHVFILDGYDSRGYFHVNYGWGGRKDGYYFLSSLYKYNAEHEAILGLRPNNGKYSTPYAVLDNGTLTFYYDNQQSKRPGNVFSLCDEIPWTSCSSEILNVVADPSFLNYKLDNLSAWFRGCSSLKNVDLRNFNTSQVTNMKRMFDDCQSLESVDLSNFDTSQVTDMSDLFYNCLSLKNVDLRNFDTSKVTKMSWMFGNCHSLESVDLSNFNTSQVTDMSCLFYNCQSLVSVDLSNFDTSQVTDMRDMFYKCSTLKDLDLRNFDTSQVTNMSWMFGNCHSLESVDLRNFDTSLVTDMSYMFGWCYELKTIICNNSWTTDNSEEMFSGCYNLVGEKGFTWNSECINVDYANPGERGYFTIWKDMQWILGDVNLDNSVDISDVVAIINAIAGISTYEHTDVNNDFNTDISDIVKVINIIAGLDNGINGNPNDNPNDNTDPNDNPSDNNRFCILSHEVNGVNYSLYIKNDLTDTRTNSDGWNFYKSAFFLDVTKDGKIESHLISNDLYLCDDDRQHQCMAIDFNSNTIHIFSNSKASGDSSMMDGYCFVSSLDNISFAREKVFNGQNWGWMPYFAYMNGVLELLHFNNADDSSMMSTRNTSGSWDNKREGSCQPSAFESRWREHGSVLVIEKESDPAVIAGLCPNSSHPHIIDLGKAGKWACCNVGASTPDDYGEIYAWGEIEAKDVFSWDTYLWSNGKPTKDNYTLTKYCLSDGYGDVDNKQTLDSSDDVAYMKWGDSWHIPKDSDFQKLIDYCTCVYEKFNGIKGFRITGQNGQSIFVPMGSYEYWSSSLRLNGHSTNANALEYSDGTLNVSGLLRYQGLAIRPICTN